MPINDVNNTSESDNQIVEIADGSQSGNRAEVTTAKRLKVDSLANVADNAIPYWLPDKIRWEDLNLIPRLTAVSTTFTNVYNYFGNGFFYGFDITLEDANNDWFIRLNIDGSYPLFGTTGVLTSDLSDPVGYDIQDIGVNPVLSIGRHDNTTRIECKYPIKFVNNVTLQIRRGSTTKRFQAGYILIHKN